MKGRSPDSLFSLDIQGKQGRLYSLLYAAEGDGPHPIVIIAHGIPGHEKNIGVAQQLRQAGFDVIIYSYAGSWGSEGQFTFSNCVDDEITVIDYVLNDEKYNFDKENIFLFGHSFGCYVSAKAIVARSDIKGAIFMMPYDAGSHYKKSLEDKAAKESLNALMDEVSVFIPGTNSEELYDEIAENPEFYSYYPHTEELAEKPIFWVSCYDDSQAPESIHTIPFMERLEEYPNNRVIWKRYLTDHYYGNILPLITKEIIHFLQDSMKKDRAISEKAFNETLNDLIEREYQSLTAEDAAEYFGLSLAYFSETVHRRTGHTFTELLRDCRIEKAKSLLKETSLKVDEIAIFVGYNNPYYFMRQFKTAVGMTPTSYRKNKE